MKKNDYFYEIEKVYFEKKYDIEKRLKEFKEVWEKGSNKDIHVELSFCILHHNLKLSMLGKLLQH